jgi:hypothetical protein
MYAGVPTSAPPAVRALRSDGGPDRFFPAGPVGITALNRLGQAPVHHQRLPVAAQENVLGLEVAVHHAAAVGVGHGVAHRHEPAQKLAQGQRALARVPILVAILLMKLGNGVLE